jgi:hypothetical protein
MAQVEEYPAYLDEMEIGDERRVRLRMEELQTELRHLEKTLEESRRSKRVLHVQGEDLAREVTRFLSEDLGVGAREDGRMGGFRLADDGVDWCFGGVIASDDGNVTKGNLARAVLAREEAGLAEDAPAMVVANTFREGRTMVERDQPMPAEVVQRAAEDHVVLVRTLDLLRLGQRAANGFPAAEQLSEALRGGGGWFEVDASLTAKLHTGKAAPGKPSSSGSVAA